MIPFYGYFFTSIYMFVHADFRFDVLDVRSLLCLSAGLILAAFLYSVKSHITHIIALGMMLLLGCYGLYIAVLIDPINWMELLASTLIILFNCIFYKLVKQRHEDQYEAY